LDRIGRYLNRIEETCHHDTQKCAENQTPARDFFRSLLEKFQKLEADRLCAFHNPVPKPARAIWERRNAV